MQDNKQPVVDGIPKTLLNETVEQINKQMATFIYFLLKEAVVHF